VQRFFFENDDFAKIFEDFARDNCDEFDFSTDEQKLEYAVYNFKFYHLLFSSMLNFLCIYSFYVE
jgi:hypothetical protein